MSFFLSFVVAAEGFPELGILSGGRDLFRVSTIPF